MHLVNRDKNVNIDLINGMFTIPMQGCDKIQVIKMGFGEVGVLRYLVNRQGSLVSKDEILSSVWDGRVVCENTVSVALSNLRKLLRRSDLDCRCLVTVTGSGYIFYPHRSGFELEG